MLRFHAITTAALLGGASLLHAQSTTIFDADFSTEEDGFPDHTTSSSPAPGPASVDGGSATSPEGRWTASYQTAPSTDTTANEFSVNLGVLRIQDWGGEAKWESFTIDVSSYDSVDITAVGESVGTDPQNAGSEFFEYFYTLNGGSEVATGVSVSGSSGQAVNYSVTSLDVSGATTLTVGFNFNVDGSGDGYEIRSFEVVGSGTGGPDTTDPSLTGKDPADDAVAVGLMPTLTATFSENVQAGNGSILLKRSDNGSTVETFVVSTDANITGAEVSVDVTGPLVESTGYYVEIEATAIEDLANNPFAGVLVSTEWNFTTQSANPEAVSFNPADDATDAPVSGTLEINFDREIAPVFLGGNAYIYRVSDDGLVTTIANEDLAIDAVDFQKALLPLPENLDYSTGYYLLVDGDAFEDFNTFDPWPGISVSTEWNFTTQDAPAPPTVVISQYYEGSSYNKYIEIQNVSGGPLTLDDYSLALFSNNAREDWKTGNHTSTSPNAFIDLSGITLQPGDHYLFMHKDAISPTYATAGVNFVAFGDELVPNFNGDDSVVLYQDANTDGTLEPGEVRDAIACTSNDEGENTSFYRLNSNPGFDLAPGSSILDYETAITGNGPWQEVDTATVDVTSNQSDPIALQFQVLGTPPVLDTFALADGAVSTVVNLVTLDVTASGGNPVDYQVSTDSNFTGSPWLPYGSKLVYELPTGLGTKTVHLKLRNASGESGVLSDDIVVNPFIYLGDLVFTQYHEAAANNKYVEITNTGAAPIDLTDYWVGRFSNAAAEDWKIEGSDYSSSLISLISLAASGTLAPGDTMVIGNTNAVNPLDASLFTAPDLASGNLSHNGNDSLALYHDADQSGTVDPSELIDSLSFTETGNEGFDTAFIRLGAGQGFDLSLDSSVPDFPGIWGSVAISTVENAVAGVDNEHLGTYPGGAPSNDFATWIGGFNVGAETGFGDDPDNDGDPSGLEAYLGTKPDTNEANGVEAVSADPDGGIFKFRHKEAKNQLSDIDAKYQWSSALQDWIIDGGSKSGITVDFNHPLNPPVVVDGSHPDYNVVEVTATVTGGKLDELFARILVTGPPAGPAIAF